MFTSRFPGAILNRLFPRVGEAIWEVHLSVPMHLLGFVVLLCLKSERVKVHWGWKRVQFCTFSPHCKIRVRVGKISESMIQGKGSASKGTGVRNQAKISQFLPPPRMKEICGQNVWVNLSSSAWDQTWNEWMKVQWFKVHSKAKSRLSLTHLYQYNRWA